ncbi:hypothetical protein K402DRAFT_413392 [Aulographum hederae CBS 113979]|uniref:ferric-chelate reductase (NADPH) n=1 Tax=Aulographum hederae CBS 113979 TaxID=1176131 RepID=A0A6G1GWU1_9PEZI|nr:hypothetical protein K402DRAFT_413392 [Aulographum hederae CBS 113979]
MGTRVIAAHGHEEPTEADFQNLDIQNYYLWAWAAIIAAFIAYEIGVHGSRYIRTVACLNNDTQLYFTYPNFYYGYIKRYLLDAPLFKLRHHREFKLSSALNIGTLPNRFQTIFLILYLAMNITLTVWSVNWGTSEEQYLGELRNRSGYLAVMNMIPLFLFAGRNNPLISLCGISFDTFNLMHRWFGRIVVLEALVHMVAWMVNKVHTQGWEAVNASVGHSSFIMSGVVGISAFLAILFHSPSVIRHAFYEVFLHLHQALAAMAVGAVWVHLKERSHQKKMIEAVVALWVFERSLRFMRIIYRNFGAGGTQVEVEALPGEAVRLTIKLARPWRFAPGQHAYIYMPSVSLWMSHPFTIAWSQEEEVRGGDNAMDKEMMTLPVARTDILSQHKTTMSMIIRRRTGYTEKLYKRAEANASGKYTMKAYLEGPYGSQTLESYGTVMLFACGVGITHQVPHIRHLVSGHANHTVAARRITLVWVIQSPEHLEWIRPWMTQILGLPGRRDVLKILLFVTRPRSTKEIHSPSSSVQMFPGKPNVKALVDAEAEQSIGAMMVSVCGTGGFADEVRRCARMWEGRKNVNFEEESFSW